MIQTTDNNGGKRLSEISPDVGDDAIKVLYRIANKNIQDLVEDNPNLLLFPPKFEGNSDKIEDEHIFDFDGVSLRTGNIMGFLCAGDTQISITSRFQRGNNDNFLHYMLSKVLSINMFNFKHLTTNDSYLNYLIFVFAYYLKRIVKEEGIYKEYQQHIYNNPNLRGAIDVNSHLKKNMPFAGRVAFRTREHWLDNHITELIRHAIEYVRKQPLADSILNSDNNIKQSVSAIVFATPSFNRNERQKIIYQNVRPINHPYFTGYSILQKICLSILRREKMSYGAENKKINGILFDGAWLWEEYLAKILCDKLELKHPENKLGSGRIPLFKDNNKCPRFPDFYNDEQKIVLDAKYKRNIDPRNDINQIVTYLYCKRYAHGCFIMPKDSKGQEVYEKYGCLKGYDGIIHLLRLYISKEIPLDKFCSEMIGNENELIEVIHTLLQNGMQSLI
jgi:5-methylcytosine-specific restriction enzyme subunit McrC